MKPPRDLDLGVPFFDTADRLFQMIISQITAAVYGRKLTYPQPDVII